MNRKSRTLAVLGKIVGVLIVLAVSYWFLERHRDLKLLFGAELPLDSDVLEIVDKSYESHQFGASGREIIEYRLPPEINGLSWCGDFGFSKSSQIVIAGTGEKGFGCRKSISYDLGTTVSYTLTTNRLYIKVIT